MVKADKLSSEVQVSEVLSFGELEVLDHENEEEQNEQDEVTVAAKAEVDHEIEDEEDEVSNLAVEFVAFILTESQLPLQHKSCPGRCR